MSISRATNVIAFPARKRAWLVRILYREPTYELNSGPRREPYCWTYRITAETEDRAIAQALEEFRLMERHSSVGWVRVITGTEVSPAPPQPVPDRDR
ncbi:MAG: hypothetical protein IRZ16_00095 [Myxococcaceae bacterium]|nr:hypothetical protein [Myxococcaceae bacterium]